MRINLDYREIQIIESAGINAIEFGDMLSEVEQKAFVMRWDSMEYYNYILKYFKDKAFNDDVRRIMLRELTSCKGNWRHDFLSGMYEELCKTQTEEVAQPQQSEKPKPELTINQIALKYVYLGKQITRENGNETAKEYGHNSGEKLFQRFTYYSSSTNRKGKPNLCTPKKLNNKIKLIESIIELLPTDKQERAKDEVSILKKIYEAEYQ